MQVQHLFTILLLITTILMLALLFLSSSLKRDLLVKRASFTNDGGENVEETLLNYDFIQSEWFNDLGNVPQHYLHKSIKLQLNRTCGKYPNWYDLRFSDTTWQTQETRNGTLYLFSAYVDNRTLLENRPKIRILSMLNRLNDNIQMFCLLWYANRVIVRKSADFLRIFSKGWGGDRNDYYQPYLITCDLPDGVENYPESITIVENECDPISNNLNVNNRETIAQKSDFMVCVKGLHYLQPNKLIRLIEWIELLLILGADKIDFYEFSVHPHIKQVLNYYVNLGKAELTPITLIGGFSNHPKLQELFLEQKTTERRLQEVIPYNDCFYKNLNRYRYIVLLDTDEVIVPKVGKWLDLIRKLEDSAKLLKRQPASYQARNVYFLDQHQHQHDWFDDVPKYMHILQHVYRAKNYTRPGFFVKAFFNTERVVTLHNHFPRDCIDGYCYIYDIDVDLAQLQHYRHDCVKDIRNCAVYKDERVLDTTVWNFKRQLIENVQKVLYDNRILMKRP